MKPTRNRFFCREARRVKMLFPTECSAKNFMKFNSELIKEETGYSPIRSYYCQLCGGWHVTHKVKPITSNVEEALKAVQEHKILSDSKVSKKSSDAR